VDNNSALKSVTVNINLESRECTYIRTYKAGQTEDGTIDLLFPNEDILDALARMFGKFDLPAGKPSSSKCIIS
jgi:hypothetical protein